MWPVPRQQSAQLLHRLKVHEVCMARQSEICVILKWQTPARHQRNKLTLSLLLLLLVCWLQSVAIKATGPPVWEPGNNRRVVVPRPSSLQSVSVDDGDDAGLLDGGDSDSDHPDAQLVETSGGTTMVKLTTTYTAAFGEYLKVKQLKEHTVAAVEGDLCCGTGCSTGSVCLLSCHEQWMEHCCQLAAPLWSGCGNLGQLFQLPHMRHLFCLPC